MKILFMIGRASLCLALAGALLSSAACRKERKDPFAEAEAKQPPPPPSLSAAPAVATPEPKTFDERKAAIQTAVMLKDIDTAKKYWPMVLAEAETFGIQDPRYFTTVNEGAYFYYFNGGMDVAEQLFRKLVEVRKQLDGAEGIEVVPELLKVANLCGYTTRNDEAEVFFKQALEIAEKNVGHEKYVEYKKKVLTDHAFVIGKIEGRQADAEALAAQAAAVQ